MIQMGVPIARCELLDAHAVRAVNLHDKLGLREAPMLLIGEGTADIQRMIIARRTPPTVASPTAQQSDCRCPSPPARPVRTSSAAGGPCAGLRARPPIAQNCLWH